MHPSCQTSQDRRVIAIYRHNLVLFEEGQHLLPGDRPRLIWRVRTQVLAEEIAPHAVEDDDLVTKRRLLKFAAHLVDHLAGDERLIAAVDGEDRRFGMAEFADVALR